MIRNRIESAGMRVRDAGGGDGGFVELCEKLADLSAKLASDRIFNDGIGTSGNHVLESLRMRNMRQGLGEEVARKGTFRTFAYSRARN